MLHQDRMGICFYIRLFSTYKVGKLSLDEREKEVLSLGEREKDVEVLSPGEREKDVEVLCSV